MPEACKDAGEFKKYASKLKQQNTESIPAFDYAGSAGNYAGITGNYARIMGNYAGWNKHR